MNKQEIFNLIVKNCKYIIPELIDHPFKESDKLVELGANSIDRTEILVLTMEELSLKIPRVELSNVSNIGELAEVINGKING